MHHCGCAWHARAPTACLLVTGHVIPRRINTPSRPALSVVARGDTCTRATRLALLNHFLPVRVTIHPLSRNVTGRRRHGENTGRAPGVSASREGRCHVRHGSRGRRLVRAPSAHQIPNHACAHTRTHATTQNDKRCMLRFACAHATWNFIAVCCVLVFLSRRMDGITRGFIDTSKTSEATPSDPAGASGGAPGTPTLLRGGGDPSQAAEIVPLVGGTFFVSLTCADVRDLIDTGEPSHRRDALCLLTGVQANSGCHRSDA